MGFYCAILVLPILLLLSWLVHLLSLPWDALLVAFRILMMMIMRLLQRIKLIFWMVMMMSNCHHLFVLLLMVMLYSLLFLLLFREKCFGLFFCFVIYIFIFVLFCIEFYLYQNI